MLDRKLHKLGEVPEAQFLHKVTTIGFHGFRGDEKHFGDTRTGFTLNDQLQDLPLAGAKGGPKDS